MERLLRILESSENRDEKLEALNRIDEIAKTRTDIRCGSAFCISMGICAIMHLMFIVEIVVAAAAKIMVIYQWPQKL